MLDTSFEFDKVQGHYGREDSGGVEMASFGGDRGVRAAFYRGRSPLEGEAAERAIAAGSPTFTEMDFIRIEFPGDMKKVWDQPVNFVDAPLRPSDPKRFPREWKAYQEGQVIADGTPLAAWSGLTPGDVKKFNSMSIYSVEQLANVADGNLSALGLGGREARESARLHILALEAARPAAANAAVSAELEELRAQVAALTAAQDKPRRGRPPLEQEAA